MKILYVIGKLDVGGAEQQLLYLSKNLVKKGFDVSIFTLKKEGKLENEFIENKVNLSGKNYNKYAKFGLIPGAFDLISIMRKNNFDIVHFVLPEAYVIGAFCSFISPGIIRVMSRRSLNNYQNNYLLIRYIEKLLHKRMNLILGNSKAVCKQLEEEGVPQNKLSLIYNGVEIEKYSENVIVDETIINKNDLNLLCVANLIPYKGHIDLFNALGLIKDKINKNWSLLLAGRDDGHGIALKGLAKELDITENVKFLGEMKNIPGLIKNCDIGLLCSHQEGFSNSILECMAGGLPMVVTDAGGNAEAVIDGQTGIIIQPKSPEQIGNAILELANNESRREQMGSSAIDRIKTEFSIDKCISLYQKLYTDLINNKHS